VTDKPLQGKRIAFHVSSRDPDDLPAFCDRIVAEFAGAAS
jgi:hypothetical protein